MKNAPPIRNELLDITASVAKIYNASIFEVLAANADDVIFVINYTIEKGDKAAATPTAEKVAVTSRINDGFWDF